MMTFIHLKNTVPLVLLFCDLNDIKDVRTNNLKTLITIPLENEMVLNFLS